MAPVISAQIDTQAPELATHQIRPHSWNWHGVHSSPLCIPHMPTTLQLASCQSAQTSALVNPCSMLLRPAPFPAYHFVACCSAWSCWSHTASQAHARLGNPCVPCWRMGCRVTPLSSDCCETTALSSAPELGSPAPAAAGGRLGCSDTAAGALSVSLHCC